MTVKLSPSAEAWLEDAAWKLRAGALEIADLPPSLQAWYNLAHMDGSSSRQAEIDRLEHLANLYYVRWTNPTQKDLKAYHAEQLERAAEEYWAEFVEAVTA